MIICFVTAGKKDSASVLKGKHIIGCLIFILIILNLPADESTSLVKFYHKSAIALAALTPLAFIASPTPLILPIDLILGFLFPIHSHIALNYVVADYVPKSTRPLARGLLLAASIITAAGLLKLNLQGAGLTETVKSLWRKPKADKKA